LRATPIASVNTSASAIALWLARVVPISSNLRMLDAISSGAAISGHSFGIFSLRTHRKPVPCGAYNHLCRLVRSSRSRDRRA